MRVGIIGLLHESNTFVNDRTTLVHFEQDVLLTGSAVQARFEQTAHELGGFFAGLQRESVTPVPLFAARAIPSGPVTTETFQQLLDQLQSEVASAGPLDGVLVAPHGATVCETIPDADGHWLSCLRQQLGSDIPIIGTLDLHANLSPAMVQSTSALFAYRTNPHLDQFDRGVEAAQLMARTLQGRIRPVQRAAFPPLAINIERQNTEEPHLQHFYRKAAEFRSQDRVISADIIPGFPYADVTEMGTSTLAITDDDADLAGRIAEQLAHDLWQRRDLTEGTFINPADAVLQALQQDGPVCLLDMGDNVGGGGPGDSTFLAQAVLNSPAETSFVCLTDPDAVAQASAAGVEATAELRAGGKTDDQHGAPLVGTFQVLSMHDGRFTDRQTRHGGFTHFDQGPSAVVRSDDGRLTILLTTRRVPPFSLAQLTSCGIDPTSFRILVAKGVNAPVAAYAPVCRSIIRVNTPGCTCADMRQLTYRHRRQPMHPFEHIDEYQP